MQNQVEVQTCASIDVTCRVTNTSDRMGEEVPAASTRSGVSRVKRPRLQLADFRRIALSPGETANVTFRLPLESLAIWDVTRERFCIESGDFYDFARCFFRRPAVKSGLTVIGETIPPRDLKRLTRASNSDAYDGIHLTACDEGGSAAIVTDETGWIAFGRGSRRRYFSDRDAGYPARATVEIRLNGPDGPLAGRCLIPAGDEQTWRSFSCGLSLASGRHNVYLVLQGTGMN